MSTSTQAVTQDPGSAGASRSEPGGRAQRNASGREVDRPPGVGDVPREVRELLPDEVVDELLAGARGEEEIVRPGGLLSRLTKRLVERAFSRSTAAGCPPGISKRTWPRSTASKSDGIWSAVSPTRSWTTPARGKPGRWKTSTRSCSWTAWC
jgi:hypothetical protein